MTKLPSDIISRRDWLSGRAATVVCLVQVGLLLGRGTPYMLGVGLISALLLVEHAIVRPGELSKLNKAFFDINGYVSVAFLCFVGVDQWML